MQSTRSHRISRIAALALPLFAAATFAAPAAQAHGRLPDPVAHMALSTDPVAHMALSPQTCANANTPAVSATKQAMRDAVVCLINKQRSEHGLPILNEQPQLARSAQSWTNTMVVRNDFTHGTAFQNRISAVGYNWSTAGENIASGFATPEAVVNAWMASPGHCRNILDPQYASVGTGVSSSPVKSAASSPATWTQDFGLAMGQSAPSHNWAPANSCR
jgi:uncharacterized protein YkwD